MWPSAGFIHPSTNSGSDLSAPLTPRTDPRRFGVHIAAQKEPDGGEHLRPDVGLRINEHEVSCVRQHGRVQRVSGLLGRCFVRGDLGRKHSTSKEFLTDPKWQELDW